MFTPNSPCKMKSPPDRSSSQLTTLYLLIRRMYRDNSLIFLISIALDPHCTACNTPLTPSTCFPVILRQRYLISLAIRIPQNNSRIILDRRLSQICLWILILCNPRMMRNLFQSQPLLGIILQQLNNQPHHRGDYPHNQITSLNTDKIGEL